MGLFDTFIMEDGSEVQIKALDGILWTFKKGDKHASFNLADEFYIIPSSVSKIGFQTLALHFKHGTYLGVGEIPTYFDSKVPQFKIYDSLGSELNYKFQIKHDPQYHQISLWLIYDTDLSQYKDLYTREEAEKMVKEIKRKY
jgi:hypothetical protein